MLIVFKLIGGIFGHSQALIADAAHSVSDLFTDAVVLVGLKAGRKAADQDHPFGHARFETLSSAIVGVFLIGAALYIGIEAASGIYHHTEYHPTWLALGAAGLSIVVKEALYPIHGSCGATHQESRDHGECMASPLGRFFFRGRILWCCRREDPSELARAGRLRGPARLPPHLQGGCWDSVAIDAGTDRHRTPTRSTGQN